MAAIELIPPAFPSDTLRSVKLVKLKARKSLLSLIKTLAPQAGRGCRFMGVPDLLEYLEQ